MNPTEREEAAFPSDEEWAKAFALGMERNAFFLKPPGTPKSELLKHFRVNRHGHLVRRSWLSYKLRWPR